MANPPPKTNGPKPRQPTAAESAAADQAVFGPPKPKRVKNDHDADDRPKPRKNPADTPMVSRVRTFERGTAMY